LFSRIERIAEKIDEAFVGQPFLPHLPPDAPANLRRFRAFVALHREQAKLLSRALQLWMFSYGWCPFIGVERRQNRRLRHRQEKSWVRSDTILVPGLELARGYRSDAHPDQRFAKQSH